MHSSLKQEHSSNFSNTMKVLEIWQIVMEKSWKSPGILSANMCGSPELMVTLSTLATNNWAGPVKFDPGQVKIIIDYIRREICWTFLGD